MLLRFVCKYTPLPVAVGCLLQMNGRNEWPSPIAIAGVTALGFFVAECLLVLAPEGRALHDWIAGTAVYLQDQPATPLPGRP